MDKEITIREALVLVDRLIKMRERLQEQIKERNCYIAKPENSKKNKCPYWKIYNAYTGYS